MTVQITALPRSGTAFLTVLLNLAPNCIAMHEIMATDRDWKNTVAAMHSNFRGSERVFCDVGTYQFMPKATISDSFKVFIRGDHQESAKRCEKAFGYRPEGLDEVSKMAEKWALKYSAMVIERSELFKLDTLRLLWRFCNHTAPFPESKATILLGMHIDRMNGPELFGQNALAGREGELWG